jgi:hypothetical protein
MAASAALASAGYTDIIAVDAEGVSRWNVTVSSTGRRAVAVHRSEPSEKEQNLRARLTAGDSVTFPPLLRSVPVSDGVIHVYDTGVDVDTGQLAAKSGGSLRQDVVLEIGAGLGRCLSLCHSMRVVLGTLTSQYVY